MVPFAEDPPRLNSSLVLILEAPTGDQFVLRSRVGQPLTGGFMVSFEADAPTAIQKIGALVASAAFSAQAAREGPNDTAPEVEEAETATDPRLPAPIFDETTPVDAPLEAETNDDLLASDLESAFESEADSDTGDLTDSESVAVAEAAEGTISEPGPGQKYAVYAVKFPTVRDFAAIAPEFQAKAQLHVSLTEAEFKPGDTALLRLVLPGHNIFEIWALIAAVKPLVLQVDPMGERSRRAVLYLETPAARGRMDRESEADRGAPTVMRTTEQVPEEDAEKMPIRRRMARMGLEDKINLALSGDREERMAVALDSNRALHHYLLKNAKLTLDEVAMMARLPGMNPDVLDKIAENPAYTQNPTVTKGLVYNPKTPVLTAIRLLDRLPRSEVMNLAKRTNMNLRLVMAAKKKVERSK